MKKYMYGILLAVVIVLPAQGMQCALDSDSSGTVEAIEGTLSNDHLTYIIAWCSPAVRNLLMKINRKFNRLASPANIMSLAIKGTAQLSCLDNAVYALQGNKGLFGYSMAQDTRAQYSINETISAYVYMNPKYEQYKQLLPKLSENNVTDFITKLEKRFSDKNKWESLYYTVLARIMHKNPFALNIVAKTYAKLKAIQQGPALTFGWLHAAILSRNMDCIIGLLNGANSSNVLEPKSSQPTTFDLWADCLQYACTYQDTQVFHMLVDWLFASPLPDADKRFLTQQAACKIIDINKPQYLNILFKKNVQILTKTSADRFEHDASCAAITGLICYAFNYEKYDCFDALIPHAKSIYESCNVKNVIEEFPGICEHERRFRQVCAVALPPLWSSRTRVNGYTYGFINSWSVKVIDTENYLYRDIMLDKASNSHESQYIITLMLQEALKKEKHESVKAILTYREKIPFPLDNDKFEPLRPFAKEHLPSLFEIVCKRGDIQTLQNMATWIFSPANMHHNKVKELMASFEQKAIAINNPDCLKILLEVHSKIPEFRYASTVLLQVALAHEKYESIEMLLSWGARLHSPHEKTAPVPTDPFLIEYVLQLTGHTDVMLIPGNTTPPAYLINLQKHRPDIFKTLVSVSTGPRDDALAQMRNLITAQSVHLAPLPNAISALNIAAVQNILNSEDILPQFTIDHAIEHAQRLCHEYINRMLNAQSQQDNVIAATTLNSLTTILSMLNQYRSKYGGTFPRLLTG